METKRVFAAIEIPEEVHVAASQSIRTLRGEFGDRAARWVRPGNLHITLRFFGDLTEKMIEQVKEAIAGSAKGSAAFSALLSGTGVFPPQKLPKVLWMGLEPQDAFQSLKDALDTGLEESGFPREERRFHPHITIARIKSPGTARALAEAHLAAKFEPVSFSVDRITVFQSLLKPAGSEYLKLFDERPTG